MEKNGAGDEAVGSIIVGNVGGDDTRALCRCRHRDDGTVITFGDDRFGCVCVRVCGHSQRNCLLADCDCN